MKQEGLSKKQEATTSLIKRLTTKQLTEEQYKQKERFGTAQKRRINDFYEKEEVKK